MIRILGYLIDAAIVTTVLYAFMRMDSQPAPPDTPEQEEAREKMFKRLMDIAQGGGGGP